MVSVKKFLKLFLIILASASLLTVAAVVISNVNRNSDIESVEEITETTNPAFTINTLCWRAEVKTSYSNVIDSSFFADCGTNSDIWTVTSFENKQVNSNVDSRMETGGVYVTPVLEQQMENLGVTSVEDLVSYENTSDYYYDPSESVPVQVDGETGYVSVLNKSSWGYAKRVVVAGPDFSPYADSSGGKIGAFIIYFTSNETADAAEESYNEFIESWVWLK